MATTMYLWFRSFAVKDRYQSAVIISGLVTFIAAYHYIRIFNSWVDAYEYKAGAIVGGAATLCLSLWLFRVYVFYIWRGGAGACRVLPGEEGT